MLATLPGGHRPDRVPKDGPHRDRRPCLPRYRAATLGISPRSGHWGTRRPTMSQPAGLAEAIERALRAPSVHNTQPWLWRIGPGTVELHADWTRHLPPTDPDRRDVLLSCGAALHHLQVALAARGMAAQVNRLPDPEDLAHLATVAVRPGTADARDAALSPAIERRRTDRRRMSHRVVPSNHIKHRLVCVPSPPGGSATQPAIGARSGRRCRGTAGARHPQRRAARPASRRGGAERRTARRDAAGAGHHTAESSARGRRHPQGAPTPGAAHP